MNSLLIKNQAAANEDVRCQQGIGRAVILPPVDRIDDSGYGVNSNSTDQYVPGMKERDDFRS